jgi:hydrogenase maturation protease
MAIKKLHFANGDPFLPAMPNRSAGGASGWLDVAHYHHSGTWPVGFTGAALDPRSAAPDAPPQARQATGRGILVVGLGNDACGDGAIGLHLVRCLAQLNWPKAVCFHAGNDMPEEPLEKYARVVLLDAIIGPEQPGCLYQTDLAALLAGSVNAPDALRCRDGAGLQGRLTVFGLHPRTTHCGSGLSGEMLCAFPQVAAYLRAYILGLSAELAQVN